MGHIGSGKPYEVCAAGNWAGFNGGWYLQGYIWMGFGIYEITVGEGWG